MKSKVIIEKWPKTPWYKVWMPILIAGIALVATIISLSRTREQFIKSSRPYVWACNYQELVPGTNAAIAVPNGIALRVHNSPARIIQLDFRIFLNEKELDTLHIKNIVRYPDDKTEWKIEKIKEEFKKLFVDIPERLWNKVHRTVYVKYSSINGGKLITTIWNNILDLK